MAVINTGELKGKVILKAPQLSKDDEGGNYIDYPSETVTTFAKVDKLTTTRNTGAGYTTELRGKQFTFRWSADRTVTKDWLLIYEGIEYIIDSVDLLDEGLKSFIQVTARAKDNE